MFVEGVKGVLLGEMVSILMPGGERRQGQVIELSDHATVTDVLAEGDSDGDQPVVYRPGMTMAEVEKAAIEATLREYRGNRRKAAEVLGIGERTLYRKIKAYRLE